MSTAKPHVVTAQIPGGVVYLTAIIHQAGQKPSLNWNTNASTALSFDSKAQADAAIRYALGASSGAKAVPNEATEATGGAEATTE